MNRRAVLTGVAITIPSSFAGCIGADAEPIPENEDREKNSSELEASDNSNGGNQLACSFHAELINEPPADAPVVSAKAEGLVDNSVISRILDTATDPDETYRTTTRPSGEYEVFSVDPDSKREYEAGRNALESLPRYHDDDYPLGVYVRYNDTTVAIAEECLA